MSLMPDTWRSLPPLASSMVYVMGRSRFISMPFSCSVLPFLWFSLRAALLFFCDCIFRSRHMHTNARTIVKTTQPAKKNNR